MSGFVRESDDVPTLAEFLPEYESNEELDMSEFDTRPKGVPDAHSGSAEQKDDLHSGKPFAGPECSPKKVGFGDERKPVTSGLVGDREAGGGKPGVLAKVVVVDDDFGDRHCTGLIKGQKEEKIFMLTLERTHSLRIHLSIPNLTQMYLDLGIPL